MKIKVKLSDKGIDKALKQLEQYKQDLNKKANQLVQRLADEGYTTIINKIFEFDAIETGDMLSSVSKKSNNCYAMLSVGDCAMFVEFGTGPKGEENPYIGDSMGWKYNTGDNIKEYAINGVTVTGWFYPDGSGGYRFTSGMHVHLCMKLLWNSVITKWKRLLGRCLDNDRSRKLCI